MICLDKGRDSIHILTLLLRHLVVALEGLEATKTTTTIKETHLDLGILVLVLHLAQETPEIHSVQGITTTTICNRAAE